MESGRGTTLIEVIAAIEMGFIIWYSYQIGKVCLGQNSWLKMNWFAVILIFFRDVVRLNKLIV